MLKRSEAAAEAKKAKNLVERMSKAMAEMKEITDQAEAKLKVMEAWVCKIIRNTNEYLGRSEDAEYQIKRSAISEALQKYKLNARFSGDTLILSVEVKNDKNSDTPEPSDKKEPQPDNTHTEGTQTDPIEGVSTVREGRRVVH
jgi:hypothetical protein